MKRIARSSFIALAASTLLMAATLPAEAVVVPTPVVEAAGYDAYDPAAPADVVAWVQNSASDPGHWDVRAKPRAGGSGWRVNATGTSGYGAAPIWGTNSIVYQQTTSSQSDLYLYNLSTKHRTKLDAHVNTSNWEYYPAASSKYVFFDRLTSSARLTLLYNRNTHKTKQLGKEPVRCKTCLTPTWVGDSHAIWSSCKGSLCRIKVYTVGSGVETLPDTASPYSQYGAAMDEATGDIYYVYSTSYCGLFVEIRRWNIDGLSAPETIYDFPEGIDGNSVSLAPSQTTPGDVDLLYSDYDCLNEDADIFQIESVNLI